MDRRSFVQSAALGTGGILLPTTWASLLVADEIKFGGEFDFSFVNGKLKLSAKDVVIDGLKLSKFTWGWIGLSVAQGVLSAFGGALFSALADAVFGGGKPIEQLLKEQLEAIARIVEEKLQDNDLRNYQARVAAYVGLFEEYGNDRTRDRLNHLVNNSAEALSQLESLGFKGYRIYMTAAGLRLSVLQEVVKLNNTEGTRKNFERQREKSIAFHHEMVRLIDEKTDPAVHVRRFLDAAKEIKLDAARELLEKAGNERSFKIETQILGVKPEQTPRVNVEAALKGVKLPFVVDVFKKQAAESPPQVKWIDWAALRANIKAENTDIGAKMVARWEMAKPA